MATKRKRNYAKENAWEDQPAQVAERVARNKARRHMAKLGLVKKGDKKQVDHIDSQPLHNVRSNWRAISAHDNLAMNIHDGKPGSNKRTNVPKKKAVSSKRKTSKKS